MNLSLTTTFASSATWSSLFDPLEQFEVLCLLTSTVLGDFTNLSALLFFALFVVFLLTASFTSVLRNRYDYLVYISYLLIRAVAKENLYIKRQQYFVTLFLACFYYSLILAASTEAAYSPIMLPETNLIINDVAHLHVSHGTFLFNLFEDTSFVTIVGVVGFFSSSPMLPLVFALSAVTSIRLAHYYWFSHPPKPSSTPPGGEVTQIFVPQVELVAPIESLPGPASSSSMPPGGKVRTGSPLRRITIEGSLMHQNPRTVILTRDTLAAPASSTQVVPPMPQNLVSLYKSKLYCAEQIYSLQGARYQVGYEAGIHAASFMESNPQNWARGYMSSINDENDFKYFFRHGHRAAWLNAAQTPDRRSMAEGLAAGKDIIRNHLRGEPLDRTSLTMGIQGLAFFERQGSRNYPLSENLFYSPPTFRVFSELPNIGLQSRILEHPRSPWKRVIDPFPAPNQQALNVAVESKQFTDGYSAGYHVAMRKTMQQEDLAYVSGLDAGTIALRAKADKFGAFAGNVLGVRDSHMHGFLVGLTRPLGLYRAKHRQDWDSLVNATVTPQMMNIVSPAQLPSRLAIIPPQKEGVNYDVVTPPLIQENWEEQLGSNAVMSYLIFFLSFSADGRSLFLGFLSQLLQVLRFMWIERFSLPWYPTIICVLIPRVKLQSSFFFSFLGRVIDFIRIILLNFFNEGSFLCMLLIFYVSTNWRYFVNSSKQHYGFFNEEKQRVLTVFTLVYFYTYDRLLGGASTKTNCLDDP